ncbi:MAG: site-specific tyrosine recombinase/integron integrase [Bacilli bacterium]|nr:site-specific tyrosine recombinase/integron integrase [Bacilli bacterium]
MNDRLINDFKNYLELERNYSNNTSLSYVKDVTLFSDFIKKDLLLVDKKDIEKYIRSLNKSSKTISHIISSLKSFYNYYMRMGNIKSNPTDEIDRPKIEKKIPEFLTLEEVSSLLNFEVNNEFEARNKAILELLYSSGLRISELTSLELSNIDLDECLVRVMGKGSKERIVPLGDYAIDALKEYIYFYRPMLNKNNSSYVFLNNRGGVLSRQFIFKVIKEECIKKGIRKNVSPHTLRHTFATHLLKNGADLRIIQELLGHENLSTTQIYTHLTNDKLKHDYEDYFPRN